MYFGSGSLLFSLTVILHASGSVHYEYVSPISIFSERLNEAHRQEETTTTNPVNPLNVTLDSLDDLQTPLWTAAQGGIKLYFEYYNDTSSFKNTQEDENSCAHYISHEKLNALSEVSGIWAACQDQSLPSDCATVTPSAPCSPFISFGNRNSQNPKYRTVKITFAIEDLAILRLSFPTGLPGNNCYDYSRRKDWLSDCQFIHVRDEESNDEGWHQIRFLFYPEEHGVFSVFTLQLISRFHHDVILIDKIETTDHQLCEIEGEEVNCPTQPTTPIPTSNDPITRTSAMATVTTTETTTNPPGEGPYNYTLDTSDDLQPRLWTTAQNGIQLYFEYYNDTSSFKGRHDDENSCANYLSGEKLNALSEVNGIWAACQDQFLPPDCATVTPSAPCSPFISFDSGHFHCPGIRTIKVTFAIQDLAILRLTIIGAGRTDHCFDYSKKKDLFSSCRFIQVKDEDVNEDGWHLIRFSLYPDEHGTFGRFIFHLISRFRHDVILIDKIETTNHQLCEIGEEEVNCPTQPTTARPTWKDPTTITMHTSTSTMGTTETFATSPSTFRTESTEVASSTDGNGETTIDSTTMTSTSTEEETMETSTSSHTAPVSTEITSASSTSSQDASTSTTFETGTKETMTSPPPFETSSDTNFTTVASSATSSKEGSTSYSSTETNSSSKLTSAFVHISSFLFILAFGNSYYNSHII